MDTQFSMTVTLGEEEASRILAEYITDRIGDDFFVKSEDVRFVLGTVHDHPMASGRTVFKEVVLTATKDGDEQ